MELHAVLNVFASGLSASDKTRTSVSPSGVSRFTNFVCLPVRPSGPGGAFEGGPAAGATSGGSEDLREEASAQHAAHVPQNPDEDHRPAQHQR